jgi:hypothetical protein
MIHIEESRSISWIERLFLLEMKGGRAQRRVLFYAFLVIVRKDSQLEHVSSQRAKLRERLRETDDDLFQEKERTLELLQKVREFSAPCIQLDRNRLLVPLFGELTEEQVLAFTPRLLANIYEHQTETVVFDLTALGAIISLRCRKFCLSLATKLKALSDQSILRLVGQPFFVYLLL